MAADGGGRGRRPGLDMLDPLTRAAPSPVTAIAGGADVIPYDADRQAARERLCRQRAVIDAATELERSASLVGYYDPRPLLAVPLGELDARGRWVA